MKITDIILEGKRIPRKKGQPAKSKKHSDLYTDEDPKGTIHGLGFKDEALKTPEGVKKMLEAAERGRGYELTVNNTVEVREGSFWKDFLNFRKVTRKTGWEYKILIITVDDTVQYVLHKGNPNINNVVIEKNPLGPFQRVNGYVLVDLLENVLD